MILVVPLISFADAVVDLPKEINEMENVIIVFHKKSNFKIEITNSCLKISTLHSVKKMEKGYKSLKENGYIELENKCFEGDEIKIRVEYNNQFVERKYKIAPPIEEERDWGC